MGGDFLDYKKKRLFLQITSGVVFMIGVVWAYTSFTDNPLGIGFVDTLKKGNPIMISRYNALVELVEEGDYEEALNRAVPLYKSYPENADILAVGALINYKMERYKRALDLAHAALKIDPNRASEHSLLGACYLVGAEMLPALEHSKKAILLNPKLSQPYLTIGEIYLRQGEVNKAILVLKRGARNNPSDIKAWNLLSSAYLKQQEPEKALVAGQAALELEPNSPKAHFNIARSYFKLENADKAIHHIQKAEDLFTAKDDKTWMSQTRNAKRIMVDHFQMRPQDIGK